MSECKGCKHDKNRNSREGFAYCSQCDRVYAGEDKGYHADRYEKENEHDGHGQSNQSLEGAV